MTKRMLCIGVIAIVLLQACQQEDITVDTLTPTMTGLVEHSTSTPSLVATDTHTPIPQPTHTPTYIPPQPTLTPEERQWYLDRINAHIQLPPITPVRVAIIDTGIDPTHPDLAPHIIDTIDVFAAPLMQDKLGHGTHTAGIIAATYNPETHTQGICQICQIIAIKAINDDGYGSDITVAQGIDHAIAAGAVVMNLSVGSNNDTPAIRSAIERAIAADIVVVAAAGNTITNTLATTDTIYPAAYHGVLAVSAIDTTNTIAPFARSGPNTDIVAPGIDILSTSPFGVGYSLEKGTSTAAPQVTATAALMRAIRPDLRAPQIQEIILAHTVDLGAPGYDIVYGHGLLDVDASLKALTQIDLTTQGQIRGRVIGEASNALQLTLNDQPLMLDPNAQFIRTNMPAGVYTLTATYHGQQQTIDIPITGIGLYISDINIWIRNDTLTIEVSEQLP